MSLQGYQLWALLVAAAALCGWWLAVRPGASYRGVAGSVSWLIILMGVLMAALAITG